MIFMINFKLLYVYVRYVNRMAIFWKKYIQINIKCTVYAIYDAHTSRGLRRPLDKLAWNDE